MAEFIKKIDPVTELLVQNAGVSRIQGVSGMVELTGAGNITISSGVQNGVVSTITISGSGGAAVNTGTLVGQEMTGDFVTQSMTGSLGGGGSTETASNIGVGTGLVSGKLVDDIQIKSIIGGGSVTVTGYGDGKTILISGSGGGGAGTITDASNVGLGTGLVSGVEAGDIKVKSLTGAGLLSVDGYGDGETILLSGMDQYTTGAVEFGTGETLFHASDTGIWFSLMPTVSGVPLSTGGGGGGAGTITGASNVGVGSGLISGVESNDIKVKSLTGAGLVSINDYGDGETILLSGMDQYTTGVVTFGTGEELLHISNTGIWFSLMPTVSGVPLSTGGGGGGAGTITGASNIGLGVGLVSGEASSDIKIKGLMGTGATGANGLFTDGIITPILVGDDTIALSGFNTGDFLTEPIFNNLFQFYPRNNPSGFVRYTNFQGISGVTVTYEPATNSINGDVTHTVTISGSGPDSINSIIDGDITIDGQGQINVSTDGQSIHVSGNAVESIGTGQWGQTGFHGHVEITGVGGAAVTMSGENNIVVSGVTSDEVAAGLGSIFVKTTTDQTADGVKTWNDTGIFADPGTGLIVSGESVFHDQSRHNSGVRFDSFHTGTTGHQGTIQSSGGYAETGHWEIVHDTTDNSVAFNWVVETFQNYTSP